MYKTYNLMEKKQTAVEWLQHNMPDIYLIIPVRLALEIHAKFQQALQMEREQMIDLVDSLKDYTLESQNVLGNDEREASEFVDIHYTQTFNP